jgi:hypothetical protein
MAWHYSPNTSSVSPYACEWPKVRSILMEEIRQAWIARKTDGAEHLADVPGGRNVTMLIGNDNENYEDSMVVDRRLLKHGYGHPHCCPAGQFNHHKGTTNL